MKKFDAQACIKRLGLEDGGNVQKAVDQSVLDVCEPYTPMDLSSGADGGGLVRSAIMHTFSGFLLVNTPTNSISSLWAIALSTPLPRFPYPKIPIQTGT